MVVMTGFSVAVGLRKVGSQPRKNPTNIKYPRDLRSAFDERLNRPQLITDGAQAGSPGGSQSAFCMLQPCVKPFRASVPANPIAYNIKQRAEGSGTVLTDVTLADAELEVKTCGLRGLPVISTTNSALAPVGSDVGKGVPVLSSRKKENSSGIPPDTKFVSSLNWNDMAVPNVAL